MPHASRDACVLLRSASGYLHMRAMRRVAGAEWTELAGADLCCMPFPLQVKWKCQQSVKSPGLHVAGMIEKDCNINTGWPFILTLVCTLTDLGTSQGATFPQPINPPAPLNLLNYIASL